MPRRVSASTGEKGVVLPGGWVLDAGDEVVVSDSEWAEIQTDTLIRDRVDDEGTTTDDPTPVPSFRDIQRGAGGGGGGGGGTDPHTHNASDLNAGTVALARLPVASDGENSATELVRADDLRLANSRTPTAHSHAAGDVTAGIFSINRLPVADDGESNSSEIVRSNDMRLSNSRPPTAHGHDAADVSTGAFPVTQLGTGTRATGTYLDGGSGAWTPLPGSDGEGFPLYQARMLSSADMEIVTGAGAIRVGFNSIDYSNPMDMADLTEDAVFIPADGDYMVHALVRATPQAGTLSANGSVTLTVTVNGLATYVDRAFPVLSTSTVYLEVAFKDHFTEGQYIQMTVSTNRGVNHDLLAQAGVYPSLEVSQIKSGAVDEAGAPIDADFDDLNDVVLTAPTTGHIPRHNGTNWVNVLGTTHFQAADATLAALAALATGANLMPYFTGTDTVTTTSLTAFGRTLAGLADSAALTAQVAAASETASGKVELATTAEVVTGTDVVRAATPAGVAAAINALVAGAPGLLNTLDEIAQALGDDPNFAATLTTALAGKQPLHANLTALAGLAGAANKLPYFTGTGAMSMSDITAFARGFLANTSAATMRTALDAASLAGTETFGGQKTHALPIRHTEQAASPATPTSGFGLFYFKADGLPYAMGDDGVERPLLPLTSSLEENPGFEGTWVTALRPSPSTVGRPPDWSEFWAASAAEYYADTTDKVSGSQSLRVVRPTGVNATFQNDDAFSVTPGDVITRSIWMKGSASTCRVTVRMLTGDTAGNAQHFGTGVQIQAQTVALTTAWSKYTVSFIIPAGHVFGRFDFACTVNGTDGPRTFWFDAAESSAASPVTGSGVVTGEIKAWPLAVAPTGYLIIDGSTPLIADYPALAALLGTTFGGNGTTTFGLPDGRGKKILGVGTLAPSGTVVGVGASGGADRVVIASANLPLHTHGAGTLATQNAGGHNHNISRSSAAGSGGLVVRGTATSVIDNVSPITAEPNHTHVVVGSTADGAFANTGLSTMDPYIAFNWIIKT